ncbi:hypothetical protein J6I92_08780 [Pseudidiomarina sp. 1APR75-15]|uniref:AbrB family transcriptional regulator n=1 Tax=Pseudidiomarina terrestris TaxID=2820060 RepID=A0ABT8MJ61_9GAMM|nr:MULTISPECIES: hypothetical protein [unclassified Pseudidiomarina]MDN7127392.1 hypothetical protein [Pseudidiomarina sp. 1APR75-33.1]MDN7129965.1 hypothetical protein [Pseudidiomarina sp. 1APR75-15]
MTYTSTVAKFDDDNDFIAIDDALLAELDLKVGDEVTIALKTSSESEPEPELIVSKITDDGCR